MNNDLVSIITPMYKGELFVAQTIDSVRNQTYKNWEMIIVDDASPDGGKGIAVVEQYIKMDERIKLISSEKNKGSSGARNIALRSALGNYLAFLDSDDIWEPTYLEVMLKYINTKASTHSAIYYSSYRRMDSSCSRDVLPPYICKGEKDYKKLIYHCPIFPSAAILDKRKLKKEVYFREELRNLRDDFVFWLDIMKQGLTAVGVEDILVQYRMRDDSLTASKIKMIKPQWNIYRDILEMNLMRSCFYLSSWALNGIRKYGVPKIAKR